MTLRSWFCCGFFFEWECMFWFVVTLDDQSHPELLLTIFFLLIFLVYSFVRYSSVQDLITMERMYTQQASRQSANENERERERWIVCCYPLTVLCISAVVFHCVVLNATTLFPIVCVCVCLCVRAIDIWLGISVNVHCVCSIQNNTLLIYTHQLKCLICSLGHPRKLEFKPSWMATARITTKESEKCPKAKQQHIQY